MKIQLKTLIAGATLILFALSCDTAPKATSTESGNNETEEMANMAESEVVMGESIAIADLVDKMGEFEGKTVQITGTCTKINRGIMGRNWIHLTDGSKDDYDFIITSEADVPQGNTVTMSGVVALNKDFGAGYSYELILEEGVVIE